MAPNEPRWLRPPTAKFAHLFSLVADGEWRARCNGRIKRGATRLVAHQSPSNRCARCEAMFKPKTGAADVPR